MNPIKTMDGFSHMLEQIVDELDELRAAAEYDEEYMGDTLIFLPSLDEDIRTMLTQLKAEQYVFTDEDLPFVARLKHVDSRLLPCTQMLVWVNQVHRSGLPITG
jgi:hypothetical protein